MSSEPSRRLFVHAAAGLSAFRPLSALLAATEDGEDYWQAVKAQFPFRRGIIPMNAANLCPSPRAVSDCVAELTRDIDADCSHQNRAKFPKLAAEARNKVAAHLGVDPGEIALVRNTSEGNNLVNAGLPLRPGDEIVIWDQNHPTNAVAWDVRAARYGYVVKRVATPANPTSAGQLRDAFVQAFTPRTRVVALTHVSGLSGVRLPVKEICEEARRRGIYSHVDGAQSWGALHLNLKEMGCDSFAASAHKWPMGPKEAGVLFIRKDHIDSIWPSIVAPGWGTRARTEAKGAAKFETLGQRDDACLAGVGAAMDFHLLIGPARIERRVLELATLLKQGLGGIPGVRLMTPLAQELSAGFAIVPFAPEIHKRVYEGLYQSYGVAVSGGVRICTHIYNTREDVQTAIRGVRELAHG